MKKLIILLSIIGIAGNLFAQTPKSNKSKAKPILNGTWSLVAVVNIYPDSSRMYPYGDQPQGLLMFDADGNYALQILRNTRAQIVSGDKNKSTANENKILVEGSNSHFGKYTVDYDTKTISFIIAHAFFPNWEGTIQKRSYTLTGKTLKYVVTHTTQGGPAIIAEVVWERVN